MVKIVEMDERITLEKQLDEDAGPIIVINEFNVGPDEIDEFLKVFEKTTEKFKQRPGFISVRLHRGIAGGGSSLIMSFGNLRHISKRLLIGKNSSQTWVMFCPIP